MTRPRKATFGLALATLAVTLASCTGQTDPATSVDHDSATLRGHGHCDPGDDAGRFRFEIRTGTDAFAPVTDWGGLVCEGDEPSSDIPLTAEATGLQPETTYQYRIAYKFESNQSVVWTDSDGGDPNGTNYDQLTTSAAPPPPIGDPIVIGEDQGWQTGGTNPQPSDQHLHTATVVNLKPFDRLTSTRQVVVRVTTHNNPTPVDYVRWSCESDVKQRVDIDWSSEGTATKDVAFTIDPSQCPDGIREIRFTGNRGTGQREFTTSRFPVLFDSNNNGGGSHYETSLASLQANSFTPGNFGRCGGGAWYEADEYQIIFMDCRVYHRAMYQGLQPGDTIPVRSQDGQGVCVLDPDFHGGNTGRHLATFGANTVTNVKLPSDLAPGSEHKIHCRSISPAQPIEAGVHVLRFRIGQGIA